FQARPAGKNARLVSGIAREVARAEAQYRLSVLLADRWSSDEGGRADLRAAQRRFAWHIRLASHQLATHGGVDFTGERKDDSVGERLMELQRLNRDLATRHHFEELRQDAEKDIAGAPLSADPLNLPPLGTPQSWQGR